jgi:hypothetical protein
MESLSDWTAHPGGFPLHIFGCAFLMEKEGYGMKGLGTVNSYAQNCQQAHTAWQSVCEVGPCPMRLAAVKTRNSEFQRWFWPRQCRLGRKKAIIAVARKLLCLLYTLLSKGVLYSPPVPAPAAV